MPPADSPISNRNTRGAGQTDSQSVSQQASEPASQVGRQTGRQADRQTGRLTETETQTGYRPRAGARAPRVDEHARSKFDRCLDCMQSEGKARKQSGAREAYAKLEGGGGAAGPRISRVLHTVCLTLGRDTAAKRKGGDEDQSPEEAQRERRREKTFLAVGQV